MPLGGRPRRAERAPEDDDVSPGRERGFRPHLLPLRRQRRATSKTSTPATTADPDAVDAEWRDFFQSLKDDAGDAGRRERAVLEARRLAAPGARRADLGARRRLGRGREGRSATRSRRKAQAKGVEVSAADVQQATRDSVRALMLIRAYRMRGHLHANLDPLGLATPHGPRGARSALLRLRAKPTTTARSSSTTCSGSNSRTLREIVAILQRTYCQTLGVEFMHISDPAQKAWIQERIEGPDKEITFTPRGQARDPQQAGRGRRLREVLRPQIHRHQALRPRRRRVDDPGARADHQARRRARRARRSSSAWRIAAASTCSRR